MFGGDPFYFGTTRKLVVAFGNLFNDISIVRTKNDASEYERIKIPLSYGPKEKYIQRIKGDPDLQKKVEVVVPRMSFEITNMAYDGDRHLNSILKNRNAGTATEKKQQFAPVPYNVEFTLSVFVRNQEDGLQILEQIIPWFTPHFTLAINAIPDLELKDDLPIVMNSVTTEDSYEGDFTDDRLIVHTLKFTAKAFYYGPIREFKIIKHVQLDFLIPPSSQGPVTDEEVATTPRVVRITSTVDPINANETDPHTIIDTLEEFDDGKKYNPVTDTDEDI
jgi:hypothetical protein